MPAPDWLHDALELMFKPVLHDVAEVRNRLDTIPPMTGDRLDALEARLDKLADEVHFHLQARADRLTAVENRIGVLTARVGRLELTDKV